MDYLDIAEQVQVANKAKKAKETSSTAQTPSDDLRNKSGMPNAAAEASPRPVLSRLPWQLERLIRAASSDVLPKDAVMLPDGLVTDLSRYVMARGCSYLTGDRDEALRRLWAVYRHWQGVNDVT